MAKLALCVRFDRSASGKTQCNLFYKEGDRYMRVAASTPDGAPNAMVESIE